MNTKRKKDKKKGVIVVGWIRKGRVANCGETMKNQLMIRRLEEMGVVCRQLDFKDWKRHPWVFLLLLWELLFHHRYTLILSTSTRNVYLLMRILKSVHWKQNVVHWVIGGNLGEKIQQGIYRPDVIGYMSHTLVESGMMARQLESCGVKGVMQVPNFKPINYYPAISLNDGVLRFVFMSRIRPEKGCDDILEAAKKLNSEGFTDRYIMDFYGEEADAYKTVFEQKVQELPNVHYRGFLNLQENEGYDALAKYDMMLFPTYWCGEGFAGVIIDAFIAGLPMVVTDWAHNRQFLKEGETALFIPVHDALALADKMKECMDGRYDIRKMKEQCQKEAAKYQVENVITEDLLNKIGIV